MILTTKQRRQQLSDLERQVVTLALLSGLSNREIAEQLRMTYSGVASTLHRARKKVRARSSRQGYALLSQMINGKSKN